MKKMLLFLFFSSLIATSFAGDFSLATWNILSQEPYEKHSQEKTMSWENRQELIEQQMQNLKNNADIVCLQECDLRRFNEKKNNTNWLLKTMTNAGYTCALPQNIEKNKDQREAMNKSYLVSLVFYKKEKFTADNAYTFKVGSNICSSATLTINNQKLPSIKIISIHRPAGELTNIESYLRYDDNKKNINNTKGFTIISGDLNYATIKYSYPNKKEKIYDYKNLITEDRFDQKPGLMPSKKHKKKFCQPHIPALDFLNDLTIFSTHQRIPSH